ncbi:MAG: MarR family transcriptional regulator [Spirochaetia bacterium]|nr:MarR family transcriptional regulator [Spirochaetia bacterium]
MDEFSLMLNDILVDIYKNVITLEEKAIKNASSRIKLSISEIHLLEAVSGGKNAGRTISEIAEILDITKPSVTVAVNKLEKKGYLEKHTCESDLRSVRVFLTKEGAKVDAYHKYYHRFMVKSISDGLTDDEKKFLITTIGKLNNFFKDSIEKIK